MQGCCGAEPRLAMRHFCLHFAWQSWSSVVGRGLSTTTKKKRDKILTMHLHHQVYPASSSSTKVASCDVLKHQERVSGPPMGTFTVSCCRKPTTSEALAPAPDQDVEDPTYPLARCRFFSNAACLRSHLRPSQIINDDVVLMWNCRPQPSSRYSRTSKMPVTTMILLWELPCNSWTPRTTNSTSTIQTRNREVATLGQNAYSYHLPVQRASRSVCCWKLTEFGYH